MTRIQIVNNTDLSITRVGNVIDFINNRTQGETCYYGKYFYYEIGLSDKKYSVKIRCLKRYTQYVFEVVEDEVI